VITTALFFLVIGQAIAAPNDNRGMAASFFYGIACGFGVIAVNA
jgi:hypothetical protein